MSSAFAEFEIIESRSGLPSALHVPTRTRIHSAVDPLREAATIAESESDTPNGIVLIGGGLGYLAEALAQYGSADRHVVVLEPHSALRTLGLCCRPRALYHSNSGIRVHSMTTASSLANIKSLIPASSRVLVAPYLLRLMENEDNPVARFVQILRSERASRELYNPLVANHSAANNAVLSALRSSLDVRLSRSRTVVVVGAGPSLDQCVDHLREDRDGLVIVSASGAVPALLSHAIVPDWVIALEAKETLRDDLRDLPTDTGLIVFPATNPRVFERNWSRMVAGQQPDGSGLEARGGSSVIPALDFALRASASDVALVGVDLGYQSGHYASGVNRDLTSPTLSPAKFLSMRAGLERVLGSQMAPVRKIYHVLDRGVPLMGTKRIRPCDLPLILQHDLIPVDAHAD